MAGVVLLYRMVPNKANINFLFEGYEQPLVFDDIVIPDSVSDITIKIKTVDEYTGVPFGNIYYGDGADNKYVVSNKNQFERFIFDVNGLKIESNKLNFPVNFKDSTNSQFVLNAHHTDFPDFYSLDFSNYENVKSIEVNLVHTDYNLYGKDWSEIVFPETVNNDKFKINFTGSEIYAHISLPKNLTSINQGAFGQEGEKNLTALAGSLEIPAGLVDIPHDLFKYTKNASWNLSFILTINSIDFFKENEEFLLPAKDSFMPYGRNENGYYYPENDSHWEDPYRVLDLHRIPADDWNSNPELKKKILEYIATCKSFREWVIPGTGNPNDNFKQLHEHDQNLIVSYETAQKMLDEMNN